MMTSHLSGWAPNAPILQHASADSLGTAKWTLLPQPSSGKGANITYNSQPTFIFPLEFADGTVLYIYMGDRWNFFTKQKVRQRNINSASDALSALGDHSSAPVCGFML